MLKIERKIWDWVLRHFILISVIAVTAMALIGRYNMMYFQSGDMRSYLLKWFNHFADNGGVRALSEQVGDYNIPYQTLLALMTYIPLDPVYQIKILSFIFDFALAFLISRIAMTLTQDRNKAAISYMAVIMLPTVTYNSAYWGQCDSIYVFFCVLSLLMILKEKYAWSAVALGAAFAFKLQAVFYLPFFLLVYVWQKRFSIVHFLWIPVTMIVLSLGGIVQGRHIGDVFTIYLSQTGNNPCMSVNYPSLWALYLANYVTKNADFFQENHVYAMMMAFAVLLGIVLTVLRSDKKPQKADIVKLAFLIVYTCVFFLPEMHERYGYMYIMFGLLVVLIDAKMAPAYLILVALDTVIYANYLFKTKPDWILLAAINLVTYFYTGCHILRPYFRHEKTAAAFPSCVTVPAALAEASASPVTEELPAPAAEEQAPDGDAEEHRPETGSKEKA